MTKILLEVTFSYAGHDDLYKGEWLHVPRRNEKLEYKGHIWTVAEPPVYVVGDGIVRLRAVR